jgi:hypothetical protein
MIAITKAKIAVTSESVAKIRLVDKILPEASGFLDTPSDAFPEAKPSPIPAPIAVNMDIAAAIAIKPFPDIQIHLLFDGFAYING